MATFRQLLREAAELLNDSESAVRDAEVLLVFACGRPREFFFTWPDREPAQEQEMRFRALVKQRQGGQPVAYLTGRRFFWTLELEVDERVLIPRPETELLLEAVLAQHDEAPRRLVDLGTGSGAIALALASERPAWQVDAVDASEAALACARANGKRLALDNVRFLAGDWCHGLEQGAYDIVVSNPPYVAPNDKHLSFGDLRFEPQTALVAAGCGLADICAIVAQAPAVLRPNGALYLEHGYDQGQKVREILHEGGFTDVETRRDLGANERLSLGFHAGAGRNT